MIHFRDYEEYESYCRAGTERGEERLTELVIEENTIYEIDVNCRKCLEKYRKEKIDTKKENTVSPNDQKSRRSL